MWSIETANHKLIEFYMINNEKCGSSDLPDIHRGILPSSGFPAVETMHIPGSRREPGDEKNNQM